MRSIIRVFLILPALGLAGRAATILDPADAPGVTDADYQAEAMLFPAVGTITGSGLTGSGILIGDRWVLTAGHVADFKNPARFSVGGIEYLSVQVTTHPDHVVFRNIADIALIELAGPVTGVDPVSMFAFGNRDSILGEEAVWVGHGFGGTGLTGQNAGLIAMRAMTNVIDSFGGGVGQPDTSFAADFDRPGGGGNTAPSSAPEPTRLEGCVTPGDSGGGVFIEQDGQWMLAGVISYQAHYDGTQNSDYGDLSGATDLFVYADWIESVSGIAVVPEPGVAVLFPLAAAALLGRRRSRGA